MSALCRNHVQGQLGHAVRSALWSYPKVHFPHLSLLIHWVRAGDSQSSGKFTNSAACKQVSRMPRLHIRPYSRPLRARTVHLFPAMLRDGYWSAETIWKAAVPPPCKDWFRTTSWSFCTWIKIRCGLGTSHQAEIALSSPDSVMHLICGHGLLLACCTSKSLKLLTITEIK